MMFVVPGEVHSSSGHMKNVKQASLEFSRHLSAEGRSSRISSKISTTSGVIIYTFMGASPFYSDFW